MINKFVDNLQNTFLADNLSCKYNNGGIIFSQDNQIKLCEKPNNCVNSNLVAVDNFNGINFDVNLLINKIPEIKLNYKNLNIKSECAGCANLVKKSNSLSPCLDFVELSHWKCCFLNCSYCKRYKTDNLSEISHYDIFPVIEKMIEKKLISKKTKIIFKCGDATLHPEFDKLMYYFINYGMQDIVIHTSAQRYCHSISEAIDKKIATVIISMDCACPYIYERIKGTNKYDITMSVIKRYLDFDQASSKKSLILSYTLVNGVNDNQKEILDWYMMSKGLGVKKLYFDIDHNWYDIIKSNTPDYLKDLINFIKNLSVLNN